MGKPPIPDGPTSITASWLMQALSAGVASDLPAIKEVDVEVVGAGVGLMGRFFAAASPTKATPPPPPTPSS